MFYINLRQLAHGCRELLVDADVILLAPVGGPDALDASVLVSWPEFAAGPHY